MSETDERVEQFRTEVAALGLSDPATRRDRSLLRVGALMLMVGPALAIIAYFSSHVAVNSAEQSDAQVVALIGLTLAVAGGALFVRYSLAHFLRFWLARLSFEQSSNTDRIIESLADKS
jgi:hypothetical protein